MTALAVLLVVTAAVFHACWNLLAKRSVDKLGFLWWTACSVRGWAPVVLGERHLASRALGATLIVLGVALLALSPSR